MSIQWEVRHREIVLRILHPYLDQTFVYGSRAAGKASEFSDLDLVIKASLPRDVLSQLRHSLEESALPYRVDISTWEDLDPAFQKQIENKLVPISGAS